MALEVVERCFAAVPNEALAEVSRLYGVQVVWGKRHRRRAEQRSDVRLNFFRLTLAVIDDCNSSSLL
jgi:hypothetical protein